MEYPLIIREEEQLFIIDNVSLKHSLNGKLFNIKVIADLLLRIKKGEIINSTIIYTYSYNYFNDCIKIIQHNDDEFNINGSCSFYNYDFIVSKKTILTFLLDIIHYH